jgi:hypothetical protein
MSGEKKRVKIKKANREQKFTEGKKTAIFKSNYFLK